MVKLSPKALRFAEDAMQTLLESAALRSQPGVVWERWNQRRMTDAIPSGGPVEVPDPVARILLSAVEQRVAQMQRVFDRSEGEDFDLGNDLAFLRNVLGALRDGVPNPSGAAF